MKSRPPAAAGGGDRNQGTLSYLLRYGDAFDGDLGHPFEVFDLDLGLRQPAPTLLTQVVATGLLEEWKLSDSPSAEQRLALLMSGDYINNEPQVYGSQSFGASHLMRVPLGKETALRTEVSVSGIPLAALGGRLSRRRHGEHGRPDLRLRAGARRAGQRPGEAAGDRRNGRYRWRVADDRIGTFGCEPEPIGCKPFTTDLLSTGEVTGGVTVRF